MEREIIITDIHPDDSRFDNKDEYIGKSCAIDNLPEWNHGDLLGWYHGDVNIGGENYVFHGIKYRTVDRIAKLENEIDSLKDRVSDLAELIIKQTEINKTVADILGAYS